jgi:hypothetical protein
MFDQTCSKAKSPGETKKYERKEEKLGKAVDALWNLPSPQA